MLKNFIMLLSSVKMTILSAFFLCVAFVFLLLGYKPIVNPAIFTIFISGLPIVYKGLNKLFYNHFISSQLLISIAMLASILIGEYIAAGEVALIMVVGEILEHKTINRAKKGVERLLNLSPKIVRKINGKNDVIVPISEVKINDIIRVLPGETIPVDGVIILGSTSINFATLTGEALPVDKNTGDKVMAGTINCFGCIDVKVEEIKDTYLQKMINLIKLAENKKAPTQKIVDKCAKVLIPCALLLSIFVYFITDEIIKAVTILVVFCPCALILATPISIIAAIGHGTKNGVLIKSGDALEEMGKVDTFVFDKTGTLTHGNICISDVVAADNICKDDLIKQVASLEKYSEHPIAKTIVEFAKNKNIELAEVDNSEIVAGKGIKGTFKDTNLYSGNMDFIAENGIVIDKKVKNNVEKYAKEGKAIVIIADNNKVHGLICFSDEIRTTSFEVVQKLIKQNLTPIILSGDNEEAVNYFAKKLMFPYAFGNLLPTEKARKIEELQKLNKHVCMIGDGINDAGALKTANVGISMGKIGADITIENSDITLINDNIESILYLKRLSTATISTIKTNISISMGLNILGITLSILGILTPLSGAIMHNIGSIIVVLNAGRLYNRKI